MAETWNLALIAETLAEAFPERELVVFRDRRVTRDEYRRRSRRLANYLRSRGLGEVTPRSALEPWQSGQDHMGLYLYNGIEYLEGMTGSFLARVAPFNVNYRYTGDELEYLLKDANARALVYHARFAPQVAALRSKLPKLEVLLQVADGSGEALIDGAVDYEEALAQSSEAFPECAHSADDLYILYTGGTTGMPKGVLWRQEDIYFSAMGGTLPTGQTIASKEMLLQVAKGMGPLLRSLTLPPFMHGAAHWVAHMTLHGGGTVFIADTVERLIPSEIWAQVDREKITTLLIVGDAFAVPLIDELEKHRGAYNLKSLQTIGNGGAFLSPHNKVKLLELLPNASITDAVGSSESGAQARVTAGKGAKLETKFQLDKTTCIVSDDLSRVLGKDHAGQEGWLANCGHIPLGYLGDPEKTKKTFVEIGGERYSIPGDHARLEADGSATLLGRGSQSINTGGEKVYPEEVENTIKSHPAVWDAVVVGTPHPRWGQQVTAVVQLRESARVGKEDLVAHCRGRLADYKVPREVVFVGEVVRSPAGKADYRWAKSVAEQAVSGHAGERDSGSGTG